MSSEKRRYELKARAARQADTRERIVRATVDLHSEVGPARTTVAEIARRAGVQRLTVYNHFPEDSQLLAACQGHWLTEHPPPDPGPALALDNPEDRLRAALVALYRWYRATEPMAGLVRRDRESGPRARLPAGRVDGRSDGRPEPGTGRRLRPQWPVGQAHSRRGGPGGRLLDLAPAVPGRAIRRRRGGGHDARCRSRRYSARALKLLAISSVSSLRNSWR